MSKDLKNIIKVILLGNSGTGKTSLINVYEGNQFSNDTLSTFGSQYINKQLIINEETYNVHIWDTAGQEQFRSMNKIFIKGSNIVIFVYDITDKISFNDLSDFWVDYVDKILGKDIIIGVIGNKVDLFENIEINKKEGKKYADDIGAFFIETSAKEDPDGFNNFVNQLVNEYISHFKDNFPENDRISLVSHNSNNSRSGGCC